MDPLTHLHTQLNWRTLSDLTAWLIEQGIAIQQIPAPTFQEAQRADYVAAQMRFLGLDCIETDEFDNVYGLLSGRDDNIPHLMLSAHTDTIFPPQTDLAIRRERGLIHAPGLGDNSIGVAGMLALARYLRQERITPPCHLWLVATTREEGLGDLEGMKAAFERMRGRVGAVINLEGLALGHVYNHGIAVRRLEITAKAEGGHSWLHFGKPSAIHALVQLGAQICRLEPPTSPRTTFNIGMIEGGTAVNAIAPEARMWLDLRSEARHELERLEDRVRAHMRMLLSDNLSIDIEVVGDRPAGLTPIQHPLTQDAIATLELLGFQPTLESGSTDANIPLAAGCPAVTIGITRGGNAHRLDEYIELEPAADGLRQLVLLALRTAERLAGV
jgi:acetylornithine deacetylase/succinyl-diaminopimelate desuccinylase-like protein